MHNKEYFKNRMKTIENKKKFEWYGGMGDRLVKKIGQDNIINKKLLEIGAGHNFCVAFLLKSFGATSVTIIDPFFPEFNDDHIQIYTWLLEFAKQQNVETKHIEECIKKKSHEDIDGIYLFRESLEDIKTENFDKFDVAISNAVFEHFYDPENAFKKLYACMNNNSTGYHQVDFRDHRHIVDGQVLEFLLKRTSFDLFEQSFSANYGNSFRPYEYDKLIENAGFKLEFSPNMIADDTYLDDFIPRLHKSYSIYKDLPRDECKVISGLYILSKSIKI